MIIPGEESGTLGAAEAVVGASVEGANNILFQITGTWVGTITFEASADNTNWFVTAVKNTSETNSTTLVTTRTTNGISQVYIGGIPYIRARMSAYTSGTANIIIHADRIAK
jgi:hypothetical protein